MLKVTTLISVYYILGLIFTGFDMIPVSDNSILTKINDELWKCETIA